MLTLDAYADESGVEEAPDYCLIAGYIGAPSTWESFNRRWMVALDGVPEFHAKEFFPRRRALSTRSPYHGWSIEKRVAFIRRLVGVIKNHALLPVGSAVEVAPFRELSQEERRIFIGAIIRQITVHLNRVGGPTSRQFTARSEFTLKGTGSPQRPYFVAFRSFLEDTMRHIASGTKLNITLDRNRSIEAYAVDLFNQLAKAWGDADPQKRLGLFGYADSSEPPLQAADLYAYIWTRRLHSRSITQEMLETAPVFDGSTISVVRRTDFVEMLKSMRAGLSEFNEVPLRTPL